MLEEEEEEEEAEEPVRCRHTNSPLGSTHLDDCLRAFSTHSLTPHPPLLMLQSCNALDHSVPNRTTAER